jgi:hypothetical protein
LTLQFRHTALQLHELRFAVGSPVRRSEEHQHESFGSHEGRQRSLLSFLIEQREIGHSRSDLWPELLDIREARLGRRLLCRRLSDQTDERADDGTGDDARHSVCRRAHEHTFPSSSLGQQATAASLVLTASPDRASATNGGLSARTAPRPRRPCLHATGGPSVRTHEGASGMLRYWRSSMRPTRRGGP